MKARKERNAAPEYSCFKRSLVEGRAAPRSAAKALDETLDAQDDQLTEFVFADEIQGACRFEPHLIERITARHQIGEAMLTVPTRVDHLAGFRDRSDRGLEAGQGIFDWTRPQDGHLHEEMCGRLLCGEPVSFGNRDRQPCKCFPVCEAMERRTKDYGDRTIADRGVLACTMTTAQLDHPAADHVVQVKVSVVG